MTDSKDSMSPSTTESKAHELEEYAGGYIKARHGHIPIWLLAVYLVLFIWALYYLTHFWGGVGPGRIS
jgi:hypothetical protein